jgi:hypothetical protein
MARDEAGPDIGRCGMSWSAPLVYDLGRTKIGSCLRRRSRKRSHGMAKRKCVSLTLNAISRYTRRWRGDDSLKYGHISPLKLSDILFPTVPSFNLEHSLPHNYVNLTPIPSPQLATHTLKAMFSSSARRSVLRG